MYSFLYTNHTSNKCPKLRFFFSMPKELRYEGLGYYLSPIPNVFHNCKTMLKADSIHSY